MHSARRAAVVTAGVLLASCTSGDSSGDRAAVYGAFPTIPGSERIERSTYDIRDDGEDTGEDGLKVTYRLPSASTAEQVFRVLRDGLPAGWTEAGDDTCARLARRWAQLPVPTMTMPDGSPGPAPPSPATNPSFIRVDSELTVLPPDWAPDSGGSDGVTFSFAERGDQRLLVLDEARIACQPPAS